MRSILPPVPPGDAHERRRSARAAAALELRLAHRTGTPVSARTVDIGTGGARVRCSRPLRIDEEMRFDVDLAQDGGHVEGVARVLRQDGHDLYAVRFERVPDAGARLLEAFLEAAEDPLLH